MKFSLEPLTSAQFPLQTSFLRRVFSFLFFIVTRLWAPSYEMPTSIMRFSALVALITSVSSWAFNPLPAQTIAGHRLHPQVPEPTIGPSFELLRRRINAGLAKGREKRDVTSVCSEWTISSGYGQPECYDGETCLFTSAGATLLEGCGSQGVRYNWYTGMLP